MSSGSFRRLQRTIEIENRLRAALDLGRATGAVVIMTSFESTGLESAIASATRAAVGPDVAVVNICADPIVLPVSRAAENQLLVMAAWARAFPHWRGPVMFARARVLVQRVVTCPTDSDVLLCWREDNETAPVSSSLVTWHDPSGQRGKVFEAFVSRALDKLTEMARDPRVIEANAFDIRQVGGDSVALSAVLGWRAPPRYPDRSVVAGARVRLVHGRTYCLPWFEAMIEAELKRPAAIDFAAAVPNYTHESVAYCDGITERGGL